MRVPDLLKLIPEERLSFLVDHHKTDHKVKKLPASLLFKLLLYSQFEVKQNSLRVMENIFNSYAFSHLSDKPTTQKIHYSSISERLSRADASFFEALYTDCLERFSAQLPPKGNKRHQLLRFDSTLISLSSKLIKIGFRSGGSQEHVKQLKFTVGFSELPEYVSFHHEATFNSENVALKQAILNCPISDKCIVVVDAGLQSRDAYDQLFDQGISFITRVNPNPRSVVIEENSLPEANPQANGLQLIADRKVYLYNRNGKKTKNAYRYIEAVKPDNTTLAFLSNIFDLQAHEIAGLYKKRWDIDVFFKFIKQELNFSHLLSRSINGIKSVLYVRMILSLLIITYQKLNQIKSSKSAKQQFALEMEAELMKFIVRLYGGDPDKPPPNGHHTPFW
ncbi:IS4 family transposase [Mucilaginibacter sp. NFX135]|uniref:IS4 family transposase n=2 Tax=unclassified Mucilaginibacter TaxID=2617802 RepID=UPI003AFA7467